LLYNENIGAIASKHASVKLQSRLYPVTGSSKIAQTTSGQGFRYFFQGEVQVYTLAQRKLRQALSEAQTEIPNQLGKLTNTPTMRWVFQCFQAIHLVVVAGRKQITNLTPQRRKILQFLGAACGRYYLLE
jgi:hypothetical protein